MDNELKFFIWLQSCFGMNPSHFPEAFRHFGSAEAVFSASEKQLRESAVFSETELMRLSDKNLSGALDTLHNCSELGITAIGYNDLRYPQRLRAINAPPVVLYVLGKLPPEDVLSVGIVGTRYPFDGYKTMAYSFASGLVKSSAAVISGGAMGIDRASHLGATENGGRTVCVIACGIDCFSGRENKELCRTILENGAIVSEYPPGMHAAKYTFPMRDRIISGLSDCVLVVQAGTGSGSLITARAAIKQKRKIFVVPGAAYSERCGGNNALIRAGFSVALDHEDILDWAEQRRIVPEEEPNPPMTPEINSVLTNKYTIPSQKRENGISIQMPSGYVLSLMLKKESSGNNKGVPPTEDSSQIKLVDINSESRDTDKTDKIPKEEKIQDANDSEEFSDSDSPQEEHEALKKTPSVSAEQSEPDEEELRNLIGEALANEAAMLPGDYTPGIKYPRKHKNRNVRSSAGIIGEYDKMYRSAIRGTGEADDSELTEAFVSKDEQDIEQLLQQAKNNDDMKYALPPTLDFVSDEYKSYIIDVLRYCSKGVSGPYDFMNKEFFDALFLPKEECFERLSFLMDDPRLKVLTEQAKDNQTVMDSSDNDPFNDGENNLSCANEEKGSISEPKKKETNQAVRVPDVLSSVKINKSDAAEKGENNAKNEKITENSSKRLTEAARTVYDTFSDTSMSIDSIILASGLAVNVVMAAVTELQAAGLISSVPGGKFIKT